MTPAEYPRLVADIRKCIRARVPSGAVVLVASKGDEELVQVEGYRTWHFPRDEWGSYAGHHPATSIEALVHLRQLYGEGARYLVFPATALWWLDHYRELADHLDSAHALTFVQESLCVIYELRESPEFDAFESIGDLACESTDGQDAAAPVELLNVTKPAAVGGRPLRVLTVLARYGSDQYPAAEHEIATLFRHQLPDVERHVVVVDNALPRELVQQTGHSLLIGGDNSAREFSAFDRGIEFVGPAIWSYDFVHLATSAFNTLYVTYLERFVPAVLQAAAGQAACIGHIDCYNEPIEVRVWRAQHWIRSCFFLLSPADVKALGSCVSVANGAPLFSGHPDAPFRADAPLSSRYRDYITQWLTGQGVGQGVVWHSRFTLTKDTLPAFEEKARAILNEQMLSIRLQALGCRLVDVTWLSAMVKSGAPRDRLWTTPWREQLANRDRDARRLPDAQPEVDRLTV